IGAGAEIRGRTEMARAIPEQDRDFAHIRAGHGQILVAIAIEIADRDPARSRASGSLDRSAKTAGAISEQNRDVVWRGSRNGDSEILDTIVIEIADGHSPRAAVY